MDSRIPDHKLTLAWGNNAKRLTLKGQPCRIIAFGKMNSRQIEFANGQREIVSGNALRRLKTR